MGNTVVSLMCPKCGLSAKAKLDESCYRFMIYTCPKCKSNVACYDNKLDLISDRYLGELLKKKKLKYCGDVLFSKEKTQPEPPRMTEQELPKEEGISSDRITDLKILLATENDSDKIISNL